MLRPVRTRSAHVAVSTAKRLETADLYVFMLYNRGVTPNYAAIP